MPRLKTTITLLVLTACTLFPLFNSGSKQDITFEPFISENEIYPDNPATDTEAQLIYDSLHLSSKGLNKEAFTYAYKGYKKLKEESRLEKEDIITICDFSQSSRRKRLYLIDLAAYKLLLNTYVAHGRNSGVEYARKFSNRPESRQSSLGFYKTRNTYYGSHGLALTLTGLEKGINDKAERRKIVVHGSDYIGENYRRFGRYMGRSFGCPAVPKKYSRQLIQTIKNGSCLFIYHPSKQYLAGSKILNG